MSELLTPISTTAVKRSQVIGDVQSTAIKTQAKQDALKSPEDIVGALKSQPDLEYLNTILETLTSGTWDNGFSLTTPGPVQAQIVDALVTQSVPDYWKILKKSGKHGIQLVRCLRSGSGIGAILGRLRLLIADARQAKAGDQQTRDVSSYIEDLLEVLAHVLTADEVSDQIWNDIRTHAPNQIMEKLMWKDYVTQVTSGKLVSIVAEAEDVLREKQGEYSPTWLANASRFATWLGYNIASLARRNLGVQECIFALTDICSRALLFGYTDHIVASIVASTVKEGSLATVQAFLPKLKPFEQRKYLEAISTYLAKEYFESPVDIKEDEPIAESPTIGGAAALFHELANGNEPLQDHLVSMLTHPKSAVLDGSLGARRGIVAAIANDDDKLHDLLEKSIKLFGDSFYIKHTPILQQEALAQTLALTCGYVQRSQPMFLMMMAKSSYHINGMSNRIGATSPRARFLGMALGLAISRMVDTPNLQLHFELEEDEAVEARWYQRLTQVCDKMSSIEDLDVKVKGISLQTQKRKKKVTRMEDSISRPAITEITGPRVVEILDESSEEDDDLIPHEKPDSDSEDEDDDPTMIDRNKPTAPVYIRDLIVGLGDSENYERHQLALSTAASLIRRKANFGSEVTDHLETLASTLAGLNDNFDINDFNELRQQALIAVLLAKPGAMAQWFARSFFSGDYSLTQRIAMLTTLGLGARELAGLKDAATEDLVPPKPSFPSKQLPAHLHQIYASEPNVDPVARITSGLAKQILSPIAAEAADQLTGPNILKVRTFSSRMEVERRRSKPIPNALARLVADNFFFPLTGRWWITTRSTGSDSLYTSAHLLPPFLHTLALILHASGPNTLSLPQMTRELWELLLSVRGIASNDKSVLKALLFAFLMLLETNENKERLATEQGKELLETQEWVRLVFESLGAGSDEDERVRTLAAGVVIRCQEVVEKYQRRLAGAMLDY